MIRTTAEVLAIRGKYPKGTRIILDEELDGGRYAGPPVGSIGIVELVDDAGQIHCRWYKSNQPDKAISSLAVIPGVDTFHDADMTI